MKYEKVPNSIYEEYPDAYDSQYIIEDELIRKETEADLFCRRRRQLCMSWREMSL